MEMEKNKNKLSYLVLQRLAAFLRDGDADLLLLLEDPLAVLRVLLQDVARLFHDVLQVKHLEAKLQPEDALLGFRLCENWRPTTSPPLGTSCPGC